MALTSLDAQAADQSYPLLGAPRNPQVAAHWNRYHDYQEATQLLEQLAAAHPEFARLQSLGKSHGDRELWLLTVTDFAKGDDRAKPAFWIDGGIHANEIQSTEVVLYTAWYLLEARSQSEWIQRLLEDRTFYLMPMMSPDSRDDHFYEANTTHSPRSGQIPIDDDRDGLTDEDGVDDLDQDGHITQMRIRDPNGTWKSHREYPHLLVRIEPGEKGEYTLLGEEGIDNDGDARVNEDGDGYYDPNRDWPWFWQPSYIQSGAHRYPFSVPENHAVSRFILDHSNIAGAQSYHNAGGMILRGPGAKTDRFEAADVRVYDQLGKRGEELLPGYRYLNVANDLYEVWGGEIDWWHQMRGVFTFTNELFTPHNYFRRTPNGGGFFGDRETQELFNKYLLFGEGIVDWHEVEHSQFGTIEVGGLKKSWTRQPPSFLLEEECHRNMAFTLYHADQMPKVQVSDLRVEPVNGLVQITATIVNERLVPTHSAADLAHKITPPDLVRLNGESHEVLSALTDSDQFFRSPKEQKRDPGTVRLENIPGESALYVRWLVRGEGPFTVSVESVKGGRDERREE